MDSGKTRLWRVAVGVVLVSSVLPGLSGLAAGQKGKLQVKYDRFKDLTTVTVPAMRLTGSVLRGLMATVIGTHDGERRAAPKEVGLLFFSFSDTTQFDDETISLIFLVDGERINASDVKRVERSYSSGSYHEGVFAPMSAAMLKRLADAKSVEGQLGSIEFKLKPEYQAWIGEVADYFLAAETRPRTSPGP
jgi:hypothetical protein